MWELLEMKKYASLSIQYSRGCPFNCEFCSISMLNGHLPRTKSKDQFLAELDSLYLYGWRGRVFVVDDNFIGNKRKLKDEILPALSQWSTNRKYPFNFMTEASLNLADDEELLDLMVASGFDAAFIGIESPNLDSLHECGKTQNRDRNMLEAVKKLQRKGIIVSGGFIVGFDNDPASIFEQQINFIQSSGIVTAMVGLLNAMPGTKLFQRLKSEKRLLSQFKGNNMDGMLNFLPKMDPINLLAGYKKVLQGIYSHDAYYKRVKTFLKEYRLPHSKKSIPSLTDISALIKSFWVLGVIEKGRRHFWNLILTCLFRYPRKFALAVTMAVYGIHFRTVVANI
jgi:radical SAM superfamily enzyme YgiQ (UPF0313 family)